MQGSHIPDWAKGESSPASTFLDILIISSGREPQSPTVNNLAALKTELLRTFPEIVAANKSDPAEENREPDKPFNKGMSCYGFQEITDYG